MCNYCAISNYVIILCSNQRFALPCGFCATILRANQSNARLVKIFEALEIQSNSFTGYLMDQSEVANSYTCNCYARFTPCVRFVKYWISLGPIKISLSKLCSFSHIVTQYILVWVRTLHIISGPLVGTLARFQLFGRYSATSLSLWADCCNANIYKRISYLYYHVFSPPWSDSRQLINQLLIFRLNPSGLEKIRVI